MCAQALELLKKRGHGPNERDRKIASLEEDLVEKEKKIASLEEDVSLGSYVGGLLAKDEISRYFHKVAPFVDRMEPPITEDQEPMVDVVGDVDDEGP